jgi:hypothetical protein
MSLTHGQDVSPSEGLLGDGMEVRQGVVVLEAGDCETADFVNLLLGLGENLGLLKETEHARCDGGDGLCVSKL